MSEDKQSDKKINHDVLKWLIIGLGGFLALVLVFSLGMFIGGYKARFSYRWAESYHQNFGGPRGGFFGAWRDFPSGDLIEGHGAFGEIIELNETGFVIKGRDNIEKVIVTNKETVIKQGAKTIKDELKVGDQVVVIGSPNEQGQVEAKLIRLFDGELKEQPPAPRPPLFPFFR